MILVLGMTSAFAAKLTIDQSDSHVQSGHKYDAYAIFTGKLSADGKKLTEIAWGNGVDSSALITKLIAANTAEGGKLNGKFAGITAESSPAAVAEKIGALTTADEINAFRDILATCLSSTKAATNQASPITLANDGYYFVQDVTTLATDGKPDATSAYILQVVGDVTVKIKADAPSVDKDIDADNDGVKSDGDVKTNAASIGDDVPFVISSEVPDMSNFKKYYMDFADTMSGGLTLKVDSTDTAHAKGIKVMIGETDVTANATITVTRTPDEDGKPTNINVSFEDLKQISAATKGAKIYITYTATINEKAQIGKIPNTNKVKLTYSNDATWDGNGTTEHPHGPTGETPDHWTDTYVTEIDLKKVDGKTKSALSGAEFTLAGTAANKVLVTEEVFTEATDGTGTHWLLNDGTYTTTDPNGANIDKTKYADVNKKYKKETKTNTKVIDSTNTTASGLSADDGYIKWTGLNEGTYTITETKAPAGYNQITDAITIKIKWTAPATPGENAACNWEVESATLGSTDIISKVTVDSDGHITFDIENNGGSTLPSTGGIGTTLFYIGGGILVLLAVVMLVTKRRMSSND